MLGVIRDRCTGYDAVTCPPTDMPPLVVMLLKLPVGPVRVPVIATVPSTDKVDVNVDVVFLTRICHPYTYEVPAI